MEIEERNIEVLDEQMAELLRKKTPQQRLAIGFNLWKFAQKQLTCYLSSLHSDWKEDQIKKEVARRLSHGAV